MTVLVRGGRLAALARPRGLLEVVKSLMTVLVRGGQLAALARPHGLLEVAALLVLRGESVIDVILDISQLCKERDILSNIPSDLGRLCALPFVNQLRHLSSSL